MSEEEYDFGDEADSEEGGFSGHGLSDEEFAHPHHKDREQIAVKLEPKIVEKRRPEKKTEKNAAKNPYAKPRYNNRRRDSVETKEDEIPPEEIATATPILAEQVASVLTPPEDKDNLQLQVQYLIMLNHLLLNQGGML